MTMTREARGGTELMRDRIEEVFNTSDEREKFQIIHQRVSFLDPDKIRILVLHDLPNDPSSRHLANGGWKKFHKLVFVSHWQQQMFNLILGVPYHIGLVIENFTDAFPAHEKPEDGPIRLIYTSTPHRGLDLLYEAFCAVCEDDRFDIVLDVYSSFDLYGWEERDAQHEELFEKLRAHPKINYSKSVSNGKIREQLTKSHVFCLPSTWPETSCLALIEGMLANCQCVHSSLAALPETAKGLTHMYGFTEDRETHLIRLKYSLVRAVLVADLQRKEYSGVPSDTMETAELIHNRKIGLAKWRVLINSLEEEHGEKGHKEKDSE